MNIQVICSSNKYGLTQDLIIDDEHVGSIFPMLNDDTINTVYIDSNSIIEFIKMGYEAGKKGEPLNIEEPVYYD